jgi:plastocyanin
MAGYGIVILSVVVVAFAVFTSPSAPVSGATALAVAASATPSPAPSLVAAAASPSTATIEITDAGYSPKSVNVSLGGRVTWVNKASAPSWPASARHPTHTVYAGGDYSQAGSFRGSEACAAEGQPKPGAFDPCRELQPGESWTFQFDERGSWFYHDHLAPTKFGSVNVG